MLLIFVFVFSFPGKQKQEGLKMTKRMEVEGQSICTHCALKFESIFYMLFLFIRLFIFVYGIRRWINMRSLQHNVWIFWTFAHPYLQRTQEIRVLLPVPKCISYKSSDGPAFQWVALSVNSFFFFFFSFSNLWLNKRLIFLFYLFGL